MVLKSLIMPEFSVDLHWKCVMSKMEQIRTIQTNFRRNQAGFLSFMADLSLLTEFSCIRTTPVELLDSSESSQYCSNSSYLSSSSNRMECSIRRMTVALSLTAVRLSVMENWTSRMLLCFPAAAAGLLQCC